MSDYDDEYANIAEISSMVPYVMLTNWDFATDMPALQEKGIRFVLNVGMNKKDKMTLDSMAKCRIGHEHYPVDNVPDQPEYNGFKTVLPMAYGCIKRSYDLKQNILVHDDQGVSTAAAVIAYFVLKTIYNNKPPATNTLKGVLTTLKNKRPCIDINFGFLEILEDFEAEWSGRPVIESQSLSIRRNAALKLQETMQIRQSVAIEQEEANRNYHTVRRVKLI